MIKTIDICRKISTISDEFEINTSDLKKEYIIRNIILFNTLVSTIKNNRGSFGTGYPFYALDSNLEGTLPAINEQLRYNYELVDKALKSNKTIWTCADCLSQNKIIMPDLKQICKPCPKMDNELKPRKIINRLPDIDMWMVTDLDNIKESSMTLLELFKKFNMHSSDINPLQTFREMEDIVNDLKNGIMPKFNLPIDSHIIDYETLYSLISEVPDEINKGLSSGHTPYIPIHPLSYRKNWQYDDTAYNFIFDYLGAFTEFNFDEDLQNILDKTRMEVIDSHSSLELYNCMLDAGPKLYRRRYQTKNLRTIFKKRVESWKK